ncbi:MAG TPA: hypothetical protein VKD66_10050 [Streptosporangiaceae bacterium]|nr:hypothetical protein [Streptosporangiaceae bacterium]
MRDPNSVSVGLVIIGIVSGAGVLVMTGASAWLGIKALGTPHDRSAGNETMRHVAALLGGRFLEREEIPWYRRPAQYGAVEGELDGLRYQLYLMPWNTEDCGGSAALHIRSQPGSRLADGKTERKFFTPEQVWHWPDLADPGTLANYVRQAIVSAAFGGAPPETR